jgi:hypothetical protein
MKSFDLGRFALSIGAAVAFLAACGGSQPPIGAPDAMTQDAAMSERTVRATLPTEASRMLPTFSDAPIPDDTTSILKGFKNDVVIGSTVDPKNGDTGPRAISLVPSTFGLKKGQLLVCNFDDSKGNVGRGTTIEVFDPTPNSKPRTFTENSKLEGCDGSTVDSANQVFGTGMTSGVAAEFNQAAKYQATFGSPIDEPLNDAYASCGLAYATAHVYVGDGKTGAVVQLAFTPVGGKITEAQTIEGFAVNKGTGWSALGPSGFQYNPARKHNNKVCVDTLYIADGANDTIVAVVNASQLITKNEIVVEPGGKTFKCNAPKSEKFRPCAHLVYSGTPLNAPVAQAILPNGNLIVANTKGGNTLVELTPAGKILDTKMIDTNKTADIFGLLAEGTDDSNTVLFYTDTSTNTLHELEP